MRELHRESYVLPLTQPATAFVVVGTCMECSFETLTSVRAAVATTHHISMVQYLRQQQVVLPVASFLHDNFPALSSRCLSSQR
jgi:hypothetical protein